MPPRRLTSAATLALLVCSAAGCAQGQTTSDASIRTVPDARPTSDASADRTTPPRDASRPDGRPPDAAGGCSGGCDDGIGCTIDTCEGGACIHRRDDALCGPGKLCDATRGCIEAPDCRSDEDCDDGSYCDGAERCVDGRCTSGSPPCDGATPRCDETLDRCVACLEHAHCDDGQACTGRERCEDGRCVAGTPVTCDDGITCTTDRCVEPDGRCEYRGTDRDGDSVVALGCAMGTDCNDDDSMTFPGAPEQCNLTDNDCDGTCDEGVAGCQRAVHRSYSSSAQDHFLTTDRAEAGCCGYTLQAENYFYVYARSKPGLYPLYRCYSERNRDHFYTLASNCEGSSAYVQESIVGYVQRGSATPRCGAVPLYRLWKGGSTSDHAYTLSAAERDRLVRDGYTYERVAALVWTRP